MSRILPCVAIMALTAGCASIPPVDPTATRPSAYIPSDSPGPVTGIGIESQDIEGMSDQMVRDILSSGAFPSRQPAPRIVMDSAYFTNQSTNRIDVDLITDRMRVELQRAARGQLMFLARHALKAVEEEHALKKTDEFDGGTLPGSQIGGADYRLVGRIASRDAVNSTSGMQQRYTQVTFELVDLQYGNIVWSNLYTLNKAVLDDVVYR